MRIKLVNRKPQPQRICNQSVIQFFSISLVDRSIVSTPQLQGELVSCRNPRITRCQDKNSTGSELSTQEVSTLDNSAILCSREIEFG